MYLQMNCYSSTGQPVSTVFLTLTVVDFDHFDYPTGPTSFPVVIWHLKNLKKSLYHIWPIKTVKLPWLPGVVDFDFRKYIGFEVWSIFESNGLLLWESRELKYHLILSLTYKRIESFQFPGKSRQLAVIFYISGWPWLPASDTSDSGDTGDTWLTLNEVLDPTLGQII